MDVEELAFSDWQIDKIRTALNYFRILKTSKGRPLSWELTLDEIIFSDVNMESYSPDGREEHFKSEALRRFAEGISVLEQDKLQDLTRFLIHEGLLKLSDLEEDDFEIKRILATHQHLATSSTSSKKFVKRVEGTYAACLKDLNGMWETFTLRLVADSSKQFVRVSEIYEVSADRIIDYKTFKERDTYTTIREHRTGYGFPVTEDNCLHIFVSTENPVPSAAYVQTGWRSSDCPVLDICFLRHGLRRLPTSYHKMHPDGSIQLFNAFCFTPTSFPV